MPGEGLMYRKIVLQALLPCVFMYKKNDTRRGAGGGMALR